MIRMAPPGDALFVILTAPPGSPTELVQIDFFSDPESPLALAGTITETGQLQDVTRVLFPGFTESAAPPFTVFVQSDIEASVPEGRPLLLLALALGLLLLLNRRPAPLKAAWRRK